MKQFTGKKAKAGSYQFSNTVFVVTNDRVHGTTVVCPAIALCFVLFGKKNSFQKNPSI